MGGKWGDPSRPPGGNFLGFDGGLSRGSRVRGPGSEDPIGVHGIFFTQLFIDILKA